MAIYKVWLQFTEVAEEARRIALECGVAVSVRRLAVVWDLPGYPSWDTTEEDDFEESEELAYWGSSHTTGLAPPDWEDGSPGEVRFAYAGAYLEPWDGD